MGCLAGKLSTQYQKTAEQQQREEMERKERVDALPKNISAVHCEDEEGNPIQTRPILHF